MAQRFDPATGQLVGPRWRLAIPSREGPQLTMPQLLVADGNLWLLDGAELVRYDIAAG